MLIAPLLRNERATAVDLFSVIDFFFSLVTSDMLLRSTDAPTPRPHLLVRSIISSISILWVVGGALFSTPPVSGAAVPVSGALC